MQLRRLVVRFFFYCHFKSTYQFVCYFPMTKFLCHLPRSVSAKKFACLSAAESSELALYFPASHIPSRILLIMHLPLLCLALKTLHNSSVLVKSFRVYMHWDFLHDDVHLKALQENESLA